MRLFLREEESNVWIVVEGQRVPTHKAMLSFRSLVFAEMFYKNCDSIEDKDVVIEDTTFDAFITLLIYYHIEVLVLKDKTDIKLIDEVYRLALRFEAFRLLKDLMKHLKTIPFHSTFQLISK